MQILTNYVGLFIEFLNTVLVFFLFAYSICTYNKTIKLHTCNSSCRHKEDIKIAELSIFVFLLYSFIQIFYLFQPQYHDTIYLYDNGVFTAMLVLVFLVLKKIHDRTRIDS